MSQEIYPKKDDIIEVVKKSRSKHAAKPGETGLVYSVKMNDWGTVKCFFMTEQQEKKWATIKSCKVIGKIDQKWRRILKESQEKEALPIIMKVIRKSKNAALVEIVQKPKLGELWIPFKCASENLRSIENSQIQFVSIPKWLAQSKKIV